LGARQRENSHSRNLKNVIENEMDLDHDENQIEICNPLIESKSRSFGRIKSKAKFNTETDEDSDGTKGTPPKKTHRLETISQSSKGRVLRSRQSKPTTSDSEETNASNDDDFKDDISESVVDSVEGNSAADSFEGEFDDGGHTVKIKRKKVFQNLKYKNRRSPKKYS
jgi:hypothetical protein